MNTDNQVAGHYGKDGLGDRVLAALTAAGHDVDALSVDELAPVDAFHIRGRVATEELLALADLQPGEPILDVGCGIGGTARFLAMNAAGPVVGVDLTQEYCKVATMLTRRVGLADRVTFRQASALELPFDDQTFDVVWTEHVQMNIADKRGLYTELRRVLRDGRLVFHDILAGDGGEVHYPVPWATDASINHLIRPGDLRELLADLGFVEVHWRDCTAQSIDWFHDMQRKRANGPAPPGIHLLMEDADQKLPNVLRNLEEDRVRVVQAVLDKGDT